MTSTVVIASYNGEKYILEQLDSIRNQTELPDEVIICDDKSEDNTYEIVESYIADNELHNWKIIKNKENIGWKANFVKLITLATKDIVFLCDQDDIWKPKKIEIMKGILAENPDIKLLVSDLEVVYMSEKTQLFGLSDLGKNYYQHIVPHAKWLRIQRPGCVFAVDRKFAQECFKKIDNREIAHDQVIWQYAFANDKIGYVKDRLVEYRRFEESASNEIVESKLAYRILENQLFLEGVEAIMKGAEIKDSRIQRIINRCYSLETERKRLFENRSIATWIKCLKYLECYPYKRSWLVDLIAK